MTFLVTGATGKAGGEVVAHLRRGGHPVRALTRDARRAGLTGVEVVEGDLTRPETLETAFKGVTGVHLLTVGGDDYATLTTGPEIVRLATEAGVRRISVLWNGFWGPVEQAVATSGLEWTVLEATDFHANTFTWAERLRTSGVLDEAFADVPTAGVDEADVGAVSAAVLASGGHGGRRYPVTGPEVLSPRDKLRILGDAVGQRFTFDELTRRQALDRYVAGGMDVEMAEFLLDWHGHPPAAATRVSPVVQDVLGRPPRGFVAWAAENAASFR
ncbi:NAD(P)H azoreductase [Actinosynnema sp. ALI-1.44]